MVDNVILITIDSLRADHLGCYGYARDTTPSLDRLAQRGFLFTNAFSNSSWTVPSFPSILCSSFAFEYPDSLLLSPQRRTISEVLLEHGFSTAGVNCLPYLSSFYGYNRGFETFIDFISAGYGVEEMMSELSSSANLMGFADRLASKVRRALSIMPNSSHTLSRLTALYSSCTRPLRQRHRQNRSKRLAQIASKVAKAETINKEAVSWLEEKTAKKFFLWLHYVDVHIPYNPSKNDAERFRMELPSAPVLGKLNERIFKYRSVFDRTVPFTEDEVSLMIDLYDAGLYHTDNSINNLLKELERLRLLENTLVIVTADHGEEFLEHGGVAHSPKLYDELLHVPLIVYSPNLGGGVVIDDLVSLLDLAPTIVDILDMGAPDVWRGETLLPLLKGEPRNTTKGVIAEVLAGGKRRTAYRTKKWKLIADGGNAYELYDLEKDPRERYNVAGENPNLVSEFGAVIEKHRTMESRNRGRAGKRQIRERVGRLKELNKV